MEMEMNYHAMSTEELREKFIWTKYGKWGTGKKKKVILKNMTIRHIKACITKPNISLSTKRIFQRELNYRNRYGVNDNNTYSSGRIYSSRTRITTSTFTGMLFDTQDEDEIAF